VPAPLLLAGHHLGRKGILMAAKGGAVKSSSPMASSPAPKASGATVDLFGHAVRVDTLLLVGASLIGALIVVKFARPGGPAGTVAGVSFGQPVSLGSGSVQNTPGVPSAFPPPGLTGYPGGSGPPPAAPPLIPPTASGTPPTGPAWPAAAPGAVVVPPQRQALQSWANLGVDVTGAATAPYYTQTLPTAANPTGTVYAGTVPYIQPKPGAFF
jgi:hypothetical protein